MLSNSSCEHVTKFMCWGARAGKGDQECGLGGIDFKVADEKENPSPTPPSRPDTGRDRHSWVQSRHECVYRHTHTHTHTQICQVQTSTQRCYMAGHTHKYTDTPGTDTADKRAGRGHTGRQRCKETHRPHLAVQVGDSGAILATRWQGSAGRRGPEMTRISEGAVGATSTRRWLSWGRGPRPSLFRRM